jgi:hypothetical protein
MKTIGYFVMERSEDYEQVLRLLHGEVIPKGGILDWADRNQPRAMFATRADAQAAIERTEHYRLAFGYTNLPEKKFCRISPVAAIAPSLSAGKE